MSDTKKDPTNIDLDDFLELDFGNNPNNQAKADDNLNVGNQAPTVSDVKPEPSTAKTLDKKEMSTPNKDKALSSKEELELEFANTKAKSLPTTSTLDFETLPDEPVVAPAKKKSGLGGIFGKKEKVKKTGGLFGKKPKKADNDLGLDLSTPTQKTTKKPPIVLVVIGIIMLALVGALFFVLFSDSSPEPVAPPPPTPPAQTVQAPPPPPAPSDEMMSANTPPNAENAQSVQQDIIPTTTPAINPDEILNADIPSDPALLKEEIDRLSDTEQQLTEQSKMIKEQLDLMNDLTKAKDEEIAILEAQIAELEKQKAGQ